MPGRERTYHLRRRCPMVKREAGMEEEDEGAVVHDFRAQARARASPSSTELWDSTERVHLTRASWARRSTPRTGTAGQHNPGEGQGREKSSHVSVPGSSDR